MSKPNPVTYGITITATVDGRTVREYVFAVPRFEDYERMVAGIAEAIDAVTDEIERREDG